MKLTFRAAEGQPPYSIDAHQLNLELSAAFGGWNNGYIPSHNATEAIVDIEDESKAALVESVVMAHVAVANQAIREHNKPIDAQIVALESSITSRMMRERGPHLQAVEDQITVLRGQRA